MSRKLYLVKSLDTNKIYMAFKMPDEFVYYTGHRYNQYYNPLITKSFRLVIEYYGYKIPKNELHRITTDLGFYKRYEKFWKENVCEDEILEIIKKVEKVRKDFSTSARLLFIIIPWIYGAPVDEVVNISNGIVIGE